MAAGCKCVVLTGRAPALPPATLADFAAASASVFCVSADAGETTAWAAVLKWAHERLPQVQHFGHAAGITAFDLLQVGAPQLSACPLCRKRPLCPKGPFCRKLALIQIAAHVACHCMPSSLMEQLAAFLPEETHRRVQLTGLICLDTAGHDQ